jgi:hypothetical protein
MKTRLAVSGLMILAAGACSADNGERNGSGSSSSNDTELAPQPASGVIVPLYIYPSPNVLTAWDTLASEKRRHPTVDVRAIINPSNGPGTSVDSSYVAGVSKLRGAGIVVLGYVYTNYAARSTVELQKEMTAYSRWYPDVSGIFFDEMQNRAGYEAYYRDLQTYALSLGFTSTVGNPGTEVPPSFVGTVGTILIYESKGLPNVGTLKGWHAGYDRRNFGIIPYGVSALDSAFVAAARPSIGYIYLTNDDMPNPWDSLPSYFADLLTALQ